MKRRDRLKRNYNKKRRPEDWENYCLIRNKVVSMRREAVKDYLARFCEEKCGDHKSFILSNEIARFLL